MKKLEELAYTASVEREVAILGLLAHPGVARLISSFKYTGSVYLVLEYAAVRLFSSFITFCLRF